MHHYIHKIIWRMRVLNKFIASLTAIIMVLVVLNQPSVQAASTIKILIDGKELSTDQAPMLIGNYTFVPLRGIFESLNARVDWNSVTKTITAKKNDTTIVLQIGSNTATINNQIVPLESPARVLNNRTLVPIRFVSESFGAGVSWNERTRTVQITKPAIKQVAAVTAVNAMIIGQNGDGRDIQVTFTPPTDTSSVKQYRALVVKEANASSMNLAKAQIVSSANYSEISTASRYPTLNLTTQAKDIDGALLVANQAYKVFILTVGNDAYALSSPSSTIIVTKAPSLSAATNVSANDIADYGDGRDLQISFTRAVDESRINSYRVFVVSDADYTRFNSVEASKVSSGRYQDIPKTGSNSYSQALTYNLKDVKGNSIINGIAYRIFVLGVVSNSSTNSNELSVASASITLVNKGISNISNLSVSDVNDFNNGLDLRVDFTRISNESNLSHYRIYIVREANASSFTLSSANAVTNSNYYTIIPVTGSNVSRILSADSRDVSGALIQNGVSYRAFVMSVGTGNLSGTNVLSAASSAITLSNNSLTNVTNVSVSDVNNYNNGLDLRVDFTKPSNESSIDHYRIFVVKDVYSSGFNLASANAVTNSNNYTYVAKTGSNISRILSSNSRDVNGDLIQNGYSYRVYVMSVGGGSSNGINVLSASSSVITLSSNTVSDVTNVSVSDISNNNNGLDLRVDFTRASSESNIDHYRILVVKDVNSSGFNLSSANAVTNSNNYTTVPKTGSNISRVLSSNSRDVNGDLIQNGISYRVFILTIGGGNSSGINVLSASSSAITLTNPSVLPVTNLIVSDVSNNNNGLDLQVAFTKVANESNVSQYRIFVVKDINAASFSLTTANSMNSNNYTAVSKTGNNISQVLATGALDVNGASVQNNVAYRIFVMTVGSGSSNGTNVLSAQSSAITLTNTNVAAVTNVIASDVSDNNNGLDLQVAFTKATDESNISQYRVFVVRDSIAASFDLATANAITSNYYTIVAKTGNNINQVLTSGAMDVNGAIIQNNIPYRIFVLSVSSISSPNALSTGSNTITLTSIPVIPAPSVTAVDALQIANDQVRISFTQNADESGIDFYAVLIVPAGQPPTGALSEGKYTRVEKALKETILTIANKDINGAPLLFGVQYQVYVVSVTNGATTNQNTLSTIYGSVTLTP